MGMTTAKFALGTAGTQICAPDNESVSIIVHNDDKRSSYHVYLGTSSVGSASGLELHEGQFVQLTLPAGVALWACGDPAGATASVLRIAND
jgi:hypothetical protein